MRAVILGMNVSLDGYVAGPHGELDWMFPNMDAEVMQSTIETLSEIDTILLGRVAYEEMAAHWPTATDQIAPLMNRATKIVFSNTLKRTDWESSRLATGDPGEEIARLKQQPGKTIGVGGGANFAQSLTRERLIDEYRLTIHPLALGAGLRLFADLINLKLIGTRAFDTGAVLHTYRPA
jgi:dihydrofolate reductase